MTFYRSLSSALVATVCAGLGACTALPSNVSRNANGASSASTTTFCMGRFLIDVPAGSTLSGGSYKYNFIRIEPVKAMSYDEFEKEVDRNEGNFRSAKNEKTQQSMLLQTVRPEEDTRILAAWKAEFSTVLINILGYRWINGSRYLFEDDVDDDKQEFGINRMRDALSRLRPRADADLPTEPGYCFAGGFIANPRWR